MNCDRDNTWDSLSPLGLTNTAGLAEEVSEVGLLPEPLGVSLPQHIISALDLIRHIVNGGDKRIWRRMTKPTTAPGEGIEIGMGIEYPVSVFAPELSVG